MDDWAWEQLEAWLQARVELPVGPLFCIVNGPTRGRPWTAGAARTELRRVALEAGVRRRLRRTSSATRTPSRWPARACR
jgi:integrase/recombinase XerD